MRNSFTSVNFLSVFCFSLIYFQIFRDKVNWWRIANVDRKSVVEDLVKTRLNQSNPWFYNRFFVFLLFFSLFFFVYFEFYSKENGFLLSRFLFSNKCLILIKFQLFFEIMTNHSIFFFPFSFSSFRFNYFLLKNLFFSNLIFLYFL